MINITKKDETPTKEEPTVATPPVSPNYDEKIKAFEETIAKQGETINEMQEYVTGTSAVINTLATNPELKEAFQKAFAGQYGVQTQQQTETTKTTTNNAPTQNTDSAVTGQVNDIVTANRKSIIRDFERSYGIDQMKPEEAKVAKQKIANYLGDFGWEVDKLPLTILRDSLDKAYMGTVGMDRLREEGKLEGITQARTNEMGTFGSMSGGAPNSESQTNELTPKQMEWMKKLNVKDVEGAKKLYQDRDNDTVREKETKE